MTDRLSGPQLPLGQNEVSDSNSSLCCDKGLLCVGLSWPRIWNTVDASSGASQSALVVKTLPFNARDGRDEVSIPGSGRSPGEGNRNPLHYSCLKNPLDRGAWRATVHVVSESDMTQATKYTCTHTAYMSSLLKVFIRKDVTLWKMLFLHLLGWSDDFYPSFW